MFRSHTDIVRVSREQTGTNAEVPVEVSGEEALLKCDFCHLRWHTELDLEIHRKKSHFSDMQRLAKNQNVCLICVRKQDSPKSLIEHVKSEHLLSPPSAERVYREIFICNHCKHVFFNKALLILHIQYIHKEQTAGTYQCPKCHKAIKRKNIWGHLQLHALNIPSICPICLAEFHSRVKLRVHMRCHPFHLKCDVCMYTTTKQKHFAEHVKRHRSNQRDVAFDNVGRYFVIGLRHNMWQYRREVGVKGLKLYHVSICVLCRQMCSSARSMQRHAALEHAVAAGGGRGGVAGGVAGDERGGGRGGERSGARRECACGARFSHGVLLKHHVFKLRGEHRPAEEEEEEQEEEDPALSAEEEMDMCEDNKHEYSVEHINETPASHDEEVCEEPAHMIYSEQNLNQTLLSHEEEMVVCEEPTHVYEIYEMVSSDSTEQLVEVYAVQEEVGAEPELAPAQ